MTLWLQEEEDYKKRCLPKGNKQLLRVNRQLLKDKNKWLQKESKLLPRFLLREKPLLNKDKT